MEWSRQQEGGRYLVYWAHGALGADPCVQVLPGIKVREVWEVWEVCPGPPRAHSKWNSQGRRPRSSRCSVKPVLGSAQ